MAKLIFGILEGCKGIRKESISDHSNSGIDLYIRAGQKLIPGECLHTGVKYALDDGYEIQLRPRSSLFRKFRLITPLATLDPGYRGEILVILDALDWDDSRRRLIEAEIINEDNIILEDISLVQLVVAPFVKHYTRLTNEIFTITVEELAPEEWHNWDRKYPTARGANGFGSTGHF